MSRRRQQWSIKSFVEWTGRKLARVLVPLVLVLGAGQDDAHGQAWRINNVTGWWSHGGPQATQNAAQNAACAGGPSYLDFVFEQVAGAGRSLHTAGHTVCDLGYGVLQIADWANASCAASLWNLRPVSRTNLPPQWPWGGQSPLTKGYDELTNNGNCSLAQTLDASAVVSWSSFRTQISLSLVELEQGVESDLEGRTKGAAGEAAVNVCLSLIPLRGLKLPNTCYAKPTPGVWGRIPCPPRIPLPMVGVPEPISLPLVCNRTHPANIRRWHNLEGNRSCKAIKNIMDLIETGADTPPVEVGWYDGRLWMMDGHHRLEAYKRCGKSIPYTLVEIAPEHLANFIDECLQCPPNRLNGLSYRK